MLSITDFNDYHDLSYIPQDIIYDINHENSIIKQYHLVNNKYKSFGNVISILNAKDSDYLLRKDNFNNVIKFVYNNNIYILKTFETGYSGLTNEAFIGLFGTNKSKNFSKIYSINYNLYYPDENIFFDYIIQECIQGNTFYKRLHNPLESDTSNTFIIKMVSRKPF